MVSTPIIIKITGILALSVSTDIAASGTDRMNLFYRSGSFPIADGIRK